MGLIRLPQPLEFMRPWIHKVRKVLKRLVGVEPSLATTWITRTPAETIAAEVTALADRLTSMESTLNWRLYGLPARVCNIKLEQAKILAGAGDVEKALSSLQSLSNNSMPELAAPDWREFQGDALIVLDSNPQINHTILKSLPSAKQVITVVEKDSLFSINTIEKDTESTLQLASSDVAAAITGSQLQRLWIGSLLERLTPIQAQMIFHKVKEHCAEGSEIRGYFTDYHMTDPSLYWLDPRRIRPFSRSTFLALSGNSGLKNVDLTELGSIVEFRIDV